MKLLHADAVITGEAGVVRDGAVLVEDDGTIAGVGEAGALLPAHAGAAVERIRGVVFPGIVNAHTHVELSALRGQVPGGGGFVRWVEGLIAVRGEAQPETDEAAIVRAADELCAAGTAAVGEVTNSLAAVSALARRNIGGCIFHEVFGVGLETAEKRLVDYERARGEWTHEDLAYAVAPHTLYTTHLDAVRVILGRARASGARTSLHLAEHSSERRAVEAGDGPVADWYKERLHIADAPWPRAPLFDVAGDVGALAPGVLLVHLTEARPAELERVAACGASVVFCPRSNLHIETKLPPLLAARAAGIEPALGTDSLASNASLDVLAEARAFADRFPGVPARELVQMATWNGARALGRTDLGRIAKGARPGVVAVDGDPGDDACAFLIRNVKAPRRFVAPRRLHD
jgi:cytosine/adenosine deaminase-related metal-dependent hydrolase